MNSNDIIDLIAKQHNIMEYGLPESSVYCSNRIEIFVTEIGFFYA